MGRRTTTGRIRGTTPRVDAASKLLRQRMTPAEQVLWSALRAHQLAGLKFRRQHPVGPFIADFACPAKKLIVKVDGGIHRDRAEYDAARTAHLSYGWQVFRFANEDVLTNLPLVLLRIRAVADSLPIAPGRVQSRAAGAAQVYPADSVALPDTPPPRLGEGPAVRAHSQKETDR